MSGQAASSNIDVRRLCRSPKIISDQLPTASSPHPLGLGIKNKHQYSIQGDKAARLPKSNDGLAALREKTSSAVPHLHDAYHSAAWRALLVDPPLLVQLPGPDDSSLAAVPSGVDERRLRVLGLGTVIQPPNAGRASGGLVENMPVAAVARLILLTDPSRLEVSVGAWLDTRWVSSTYELTEELESLHLATLTERDSRSSSVTVIADEAGSAAADERLAAIGAVLGFELVVIREPTANSKAAAALKRQSPSLLLIAQSVMPRVGDAISAFRKAGGEPLSLPDSSEDRLIDATRRHLIEASMLTPSLTCWPALTRDTTPDTYRYIEKPPLPVSSPGRCMRHRTTRSRYVEDANTGLWYTNDWANHSSQPQDSPVAFKQFRANEGKGLEWVADLDERANPIEEKHKGPDYKFIPWSHLHGC